MKSCSWIIVSAVLIGCASLASPAWSATSAKAQKPLNAGHPSTRGAPAANRSASGSGKAAGSKYLADTDLLARVGDQRITVYDFRDRYFESDAKFRPASDSLGRIEFLNSMIDKEVMARVAHQVNPELGFVDRVKLRDATHTILTNVLYQRYAADSVHLTKAEVQAVYPQYQRELHLREILFPDRQMAERVRHELRNGRITWADAARRYSLAKDRGADGDMGWVNRTQITGEVGLTVFALEPGTVSEVVQDMKGYHLVQIVDSRPWEGPPFQSMERFIYKDVWSSRIDPLVEKLILAARERAQVKYDTANIQWAAQRFADLLALGSPEGPTIDLSGKLPSFATADTGRVLARTRDRAFSLNDFLTQYRATSPVLRRRVISLEPFIFTLDTFLLQPDMVAIALDRGIDRDSLAKAQIEERKEALMVEHVHQDSVVSKVRVTPAEKRQYYEAHRKEFVTIPSVRYAQMILPTEHAADSLIARLDAGERIEPMVRADSLLGRRTSAIRVLKRGEPNDYSKLLFEELRPGKSTKLGPDRDGKFMVLHLIEYRPETPMSYDQVEGIVDESLINIKSQNLLDAFIARHKRGLKIESHPELVMRVHLIDPTLELAYD